MKIINDNNCKSKFMFNLSAFFVIIFLFLFLLITVNTTNGGLDVTPVYSVDINVRDITIVRSGDFAKFKVKIKNKGAPLLNCKIFFVVRKVGTNKRYRFGPFNCNNLSFNKEISVEFDWKVPSRERGKYKYRVIIKDESGFTDRSKWDLFTIKKALHGELKIFDKIKLTFFITPRKENWRLLYILMEILFLGIL